MPVLDLHTLTVTIGIIMLVLGLMVAYYNSSQMTYPGFKECAAGYIIFGAGMFLRGLRSYFPDFITIVLANGSVYISFLFFYTGFSSFALRKINLRLHISLIILFSCILHPFFTYIKPDVAIRVLLTSSAAAFYFLLCTSVLIRDINKGISGADRVLVAALIFISFLNIVRGCFFIIQKYFSASLMAGSSTLQVGIFDSISLLIFVILSIIFVFGIIQLNSRLLERDFAFEKVQLRKSEEKYRLFVEHSLQGLMIIQQDPLRISFISRPMEAITGYSRDELLDLRKQELIDLIYPEDRERFWTVFQDFISRIPVSPIHEYRIRHRTKGIRWLESYSTLTEHNSSPAVQMVFIDRTERKTAENALNEIRLRYEHLSEKLKDRMILFAHDIRGRFIYASEGLHLIGSGLSPSDVVGKRWKDIAQWEPESVKAAVAHTEMMLADQSFSTPLELSYIHTDSTRHFLIVYEFIVYNHEREENLIEGVAIDVTEQKRREDGLHILMRAVENTSASVVITDTKGDITYVNPAFEKITGYLKEEVMNKNPRFLKSGVHDSNFYSRIWDTISGGNTWSGDICNMKKDGTLYWESASISPVQDESCNIVNYVAVKDDITDKKELERLKDDVDRIMRHDLKAPLNAIIGFPQVMQMNSYLSEDQLNILRIIENSGRKMLSMIDMSLDMFKMESGRYSYTPEPVDALNVIMQIIGESHSTHSEKGSVCRVVVNGSLIFKSGHNVIFRDRKDDAEEMDRFIIWSEERLLYSLLSNLYINAVEASPESSPVTVEMTDFRVNGESVSKSISIKNSGAVPEAVRECFFGKYKTHGKTSGTGLGTYSAKLLAETMGYRIVMETSDDQDSTCITINIPLYDDIPDA